MFRFLTSVAVAALLVGCSGSDESATTTVPSTSAIAETAPTTSATTAVPTTVASTAPTTSPTTTTAPSTTAPTTLPAPTTEPFAPIDDPEPVTEAAVINALDEYWAQQAACFADPEGCVIDETTRAGGIVLESLEFSVERALEYGQTGQVETARGDVVLDEVAETASVAVCEYGWDSSQDRSEGVLFDLSTYELYRVDGRWTLVSFTLDDSVPRTVECGP